MSFVCLSLYAEDDEDENKTVKVGNFYLPSSQQPGPLVGIGENIIGKGQTQVFYLGDYYRGKNKYFIDAFPSVLYGISDKLSIFINAPFAIRYKDSIHHSKGIEDVFVQLEYAFYNKEEKYYVEQATVVGNVSFPTGSATAIPPTGFGTPSAFLGFTYNYTGVDWFYFGACGATVTGTHNGTKIGNQYLYEAGFGRNILNSAGWMYAWMIEIDGYYTEKNKIKGSVDPNSNGNVIYVTPSLWISSEHWIVQLGAGCAIQQHLFGHQGRNQYLLIGNFGRTF